MKPAPELLAPAGNRDCVRAAVANGADAVYFGLPRFNARIRADNFTEEELPEIVDFCHNHGVKTYAAFNTLIFTDELESAADQLRLLSRAGVDAIIVQDVGLVRLSREITPDLPLHASTQMTITSPEGVRFARELGIERVVLARELSLREIEKFDDGMPLEMFVHGALCVAYSGQCLTSESLGQRSANRGECAQACRMPYQLVVDGELRDLGDKRYLLSPQDLAAVDDIPALIDLGICSFKIEGRLKSPEYVAAVCQVYRKAIDAALAHKPSASNAEDRYKLEMTFSRGLYSGWLHGVNHQELVSARFGKKRGPFVGRITHIGRDQVEVRLENSDEPPLKAGDGIVFDTGGDTNAEQGGRIWRVDGVRLHFERGAIDFNRIHAGDRIWKTDDPALDSQLRKSYAGRLEPRKRERIALRVSGKAGEPLMLGAGDICVSSAMPLQAARNAPLTTEKLREHLGRFGESVYELGEFTNALEGAVILPIGELNRLRRELVYRLDAARKARRDEKSVTVREILATIAGGNPLDKIGAPGLSILCRDMEQIGAALECGVKTIHVDFEDVRRYKAAVELVRQKKDAQIFLATPRIQKAGEQGFFKLIENAAPDGVLVRNLGAIEYFAESPLQKVGDFSLNIANPLSARLFWEKGLARLTISCDLNVAQVLALLRAAPPGWFELIIHQHMPMFHMEHCVFAAFMSQGKSFLDCGRPCDRHRVHLRDRVGAEHPLRADAGCRNTLFNASAQTGAGFYEDFREAGLRHFRVDLLGETAGETREIIRAYQALLAGKTGGTELWRSLRARQQLGVTHSV